MTSILLNEFSGSYQPVDGLNIIGVRDQDNWVTGCVDEHMFQAKVFAEPSEYGINEGRVSKLTVTNDGIVFFNWDRGPDVGNRNCQIVKKILKAFA